jgi:hypothetical protein
MEYFVARTSSLFIPVKCFSLLRSHRFCPVRRVPRRSVTSYPTLVIRKSSEGRFYLAQLGLGC